MGEQMYPSQGPAVDYRCPVLVVTGDYRYPALVVTGEQMYRAQEEPAPVPAHIPTSSPAFDGSTIPATQPRQPVHQ